MRYPWLKASFLVVYCLLFAIAPVLAASAPDSMTVDNGESLIANDIALGQTLTCLALQAGISLQDLLATNRALSPDALARMGLYRSYAASDQLKAFQARPEDSFFTLAVRHAIPYWLLRTSQQAPIYQGQWIVLPGEPSRCLPFPLTTVRLVPGVLRQGQVTLLELTTAEPATCEVTYLGRTEPCFAGDGVTLYGLLAASALNDPGPVDITVRVSTATSVSEFGTTTVIEPADFGFQRIDPPISMFELVAQGLLQTESDYLTPWRTVRTTERRWRLPLNSPLSPAAAISADFGDRRSYGGMIDGYHSGIDYRAWGGTPVYAPADGVVIFADRLTARGNAVLLDHGWGLVTGYWHLSLIDVEVGDSVSQGESFARVGNTGLSTGAHLHWEVWINGVSVDGAQMLDSSTFSDTLLTLPVNADIAELSSLNAQ